MNLDDYQRLAARTLPDLAYPMLDLNMALGLAGETGELVDHIKKYIFHDHDLGDGLVGELGDVLWYLAGVCTAHGFDLSTVAAANIEKLRRRYPEGFSAERSRNRDVEHEIVASIWDDEADAYAAQMGFAPQAKGFTGAVG